MKAATVFSEYVKSENYRLFVVVNFISYLGFLAHLAFIPLFFWIGYDSLAYFNVFSILAWFTAYIFNQYGRHIYAIALISVEVFIHAILATYILGWDSGFHYYLIPFVLFVFINHKQSVAVLGGQVIAVFVVYMWLLINTNHGVYEQVLGTEVIDALQVMNIAVNFFAIGLLGYALRTSSMRAEWEMEQLAIKDSLTGLYNRRKMYEMIALEKVRMQRNGKASVLVIADIDWFKAINDEYGHDCGDDVLKKVSTLMQTSLRQQDILSRWGGEEFMLLLPETSNDGAMKVIDVLRTTIATHDFEYCGNHLSVTMTFGMQVFDNTQPVEDIIKQADNSLYKGKEKGRNCVISAFEF